MLLRVLFIFNFFICFVHSGKDSKETLPMPCQVSLYTEPLTAMKKTRTDRFVKDHEHVKHWALLFEFYELEIRRGIVIELYRDGGKVNSIWREVPLGEMKDVNKIELFKKDTMNRNGNFGLVFGRGEILLTYMIFVYHWTS